MPHYADNGSEPEPYYVPGGGRASSRKIDWASMTPGGDLPF